MVKYLRSTSTGVVLPYNKGLLKRPNVEELTAEECVAYEASVKKPKPAPVAAAPEPVPEPIPEPEPAPTPEPAPEVAVQDVSDGEPSAEELLAALDG